MCDSFAVYIGAGTNLKIIKNIPNIKKFVFIDNQPNSKFEIEDNRCCWWDSFLPFTDRLCKSEFISELKNTAENENISIISEEANLEESNKQLCFKYKDQTIYYLINTSIPEDLCEIKNKIEDFDNLIISSFFPHYSILNYTKKTVTFWGTSDINYSEEKKCNYLYENNKATQTIIYKLNYESLFEKKFNTFNFIQKNGIIKYFRFWDNFISNSFTI